MTLDHYTTAGAPVILKWDPKNLEIRTMSVEKTLEPLVIQVTRGGRGPPSAPQIWHGVPVSRADVVLPVRSHPAITHSPESLTEFGQKAMNTRETCITNQVTHALHDSERRHTNTQATRTSQPTSAPSPKIIPPTHQPPCSLPSQ